jgi:hypothetical protein
MNSTLEEFIKQFRASDYRSWIEMNGRVMPNLRIIRFEHMRADFSKYCKEFELKDVKIPHLNKAQKPDYDRTITPELEPIVYNKYKYLFENGFYERMKFPAEA